jgi:hypothetical protein
MSLKYRRLLCCLFIMVPVAAPVLSQQVADTGFRPIVGDPAYAPDRGPLVLLDEAHFNFHTTTGRYLPFTRLLVRDGYVVRPNRALFSAESLRSARVLVIANALPDSGEWVLPTGPAFTPAEVASVERWVREGGSLLLIADHMPFPGAAEHLARAFGVVFANGFAFALPDRRGELVFRRTDQSLAAAPVTDGRNAGERVDSVRSFTGQAFRLTGPGMPLLTVGPDVELLLPRVAWQFDSTTARVSAAGMLQGALLRHGQGRVAVFGEAAMFSAQVTGPGRVPMGMNAPRASRNAQFALNVMHWLSGLLEP